MPNRVLLITAGETPQLVTETLYGLLAQGWVPDEIVLATTSAGKALFERGGGYHDLPPLLGDQGKLAALLAEFGRTVPPVRFVLAADTNGDPCDDVRSDYQVNAFAGALFDAVRAITDDRDTELHLSIAGGRKTMSFVAGQVMSFCGRPHDRLSHCLVEPREKESKRDFWWPQAGDEARIDLHEVEFLRLRAHLEVNDVFPKVGGWLGGVAAANSALAVDRMTVDFTSQTVTVGTSSVSWNKSRNFSVLALIAVAGKLQEPLVSDTMNGSSDRFWLNLARCEALIHLDEIYEGGADWVGVNPNRLLADIAGRQATMLGKTREHPGWDSHWNSYWTGPKARLLAELRAFPAFARAQIIARTKKTSGISATAYRPDQIQLILPADLTLDFFRYG